MRCVRDLREARMQGSGLRRSGIAADLRAHNVTPHIAHNISGRRTAVDGRTTRHAGYAVSQRKRKRIKEPFGWGKTDRRTCMGSSSSNAGNIY